MLLISIIYVIDIIMAKIQSIRLPPKIELEKKHLHEGFYIILSDKYNLSWIICLVCAL
jgi:hypothetical protein